LPWKDYITSIVSIEISEGITMVGENFCSGTGITEISLPSSLKSLGKDSFANCANLKEVTFNSQVTISNPVFSNDPSLHYVIVPDIKYEYYQNLICDKLGYSSVFIVLNGDLTRKTDTDTGIDWFFSTENSGLTIHYIGELSDVSSDDFPWRNFSGGVDYSEEIKTVILEEGITTIHWDLFCDLTNLETINIPPTCTYIEDITMTFDFNENLKSIEVSGENQTYKSVDGV
jgi:hypothetical protein